MTENDNVTIGTKFFRHVSAKHCDTICTDMKITRLSNGLSILQSIGLFYYDPEYTTCPCIYHFEI